MTKKYFPISLLTTLLLAMPPVLLTSCQAKSNSVDRASLPSKAPNIVGTMTQADNLEGTKAINNLESNSTESNNERLMRLAMDIQHSLAERDFQAIVPHIHPTKGVRFSMYAYVKPESDKVFSREQFARYLSESKIKFTWGLTDGKGDVYVAPLPDYLTSWVKADTFKPSNANLNEFKGSGNSLNNLKEIYPNAYFVEFYYPGTKKYGGIDWRALRLVFEDYQGEPYLVAIIHDEWTT